MPNRRQRHHHIDRYKDKKGRWRVWIGHSEDLYDIPSDQIWWWFHYVCSWIGRKLSRPTYRKVWVDGQRRERCYAIESELEKIEEAQRHNSKPDVRKKWPKDPERPKDATPFTKIQEQFPKATERRLMWAHKHRGLWVALLQARDKAGDVREMLHASLAKVKELLKDLKAAPGRTVDNPYTDPSETVWWPPELHWRKFGIRPALLGAIRRSKKVHPALGEKIRFLEPTKVPASVRRNQKVYYYLPEQGEKIGKWLKQSRPLQQAKAFLLKLVANGPVDHKKVKSEADLAGISRSTLQRAREALEKAGEFDTSRRRYQGTSFWHIPGDKPPDAPRESRPHPKLDLALQLLRSVPDPEEAFPELVRQVRQANKSPTMLYTAREVLRQERAERNGQAGDGAHLDPIVPPRPNTKTPEHPNYPGHIKKPYHTGRHPNEDRDVVLQFCYDSYIVAMRPPKEVMERASKDYGPKYAPKSKDDVKRYAREWASKFEPPLPTQRATAATKFKVNSHG
jgi:hypothetical protein